MDFRATMRVNRGRIILDHVRGIDVERKNSQEAWTFAEARKILFHGRVYDYQYKRCLQCQHSSLIDVNYAYCPQKEQKKRKLICFKGIPNPENCIVQAMQSFYEIEGCFRGEIINNRLI